MNPRELFLTVREGALASLLAIPFIIQVAVAAEPCGPPVLERGVVGGIRPGVELTLVDGRVLRLAGLHAPEALVLPLRPGDIIGFAILGDADRWSRHPAIVFLAIEGSAPVWLQDRLARAGAVAVRPEASLGGCWPLLQAAEAAATTRPGLPEDAGRFARIEGRVSRIGEGRTAHFVTVFAADGKRVTGLVQKRHLRRLSQGGVDVAGLKGHIVRLRGIRSLRNPHVIALTQADQIEIVR